MSVTKFLITYEKSIYIFSCALLFLFSSISTIRSVRTHYKFISHPYQIEYREGGALNATQLYLKDRNLFSISEQPQNTYVYGFLYALAVKPFAKHMETHFWFTGHSYIFLYAQPACLSFMYY